jgi:nucleoside-diphosphate-sugar epimerase
MNKKHDSSNMNCVALVTGATGFVGSHLVKKLIDKGCEVHAIVRTGSDVENIVNNGISLHVHDGSSERMFQIVSHIKPDVVFHLSSLFLSQHELGDVQALINSNILFGNQLLDAMRISNVGNFINTGTSWQHYKNDEYNPVCLYAASKKAFEAILEYYIQACEMKAITLKLFDTYGANDDRPKLFNFLKKMARTGQVLDMTEGEQLIDIVHIDDVVESYVVAAQLLLAGKISTHKFYSVSSGRPIKLKNLVELYFKITKQKSFVRWGAKPYRSREVMQPWSKGENLLPYDILISLEDGLKDVFHSNDKY